MPRLSGWYKVGLIGVVMALLSVPVMAECTICKTTTAPTLVAEVQAVTNVTPTAAPTTAPPTTAPFPTESPLPTATPTQVVTPIPTQTVLPGPEGTLPLLPGWNCISLPSPLSADYRKAGLLFWGLDTEGHSIYSYHAATSQWKTLAFDSPIVPLDGIWVYSATSVNVPFRYESAQPAPVSKSLYAGWNSMGFAIKEATAAKDAMTSVKDSWIFIIGYNSAGQKSETSIVRGSSDPAFSDSRPVYPMQGYWVSMNGKGTYTG
jgi:hypothetical protein